MNKFLSILLPHSDDELFILPFIESRIKLGFDVKIFFITYDLNPLREGESGKMLGQYKNVQVIPFGRLNNIMDGKLSESYQKVLQLLEENPLIQSSEYLVCPMFEAGHVDHDEIFKITYALASNTNRPLFTFSLYNAFKTPFVRVATIFQGPVKGEIMVIPFSFRSGFNFLRKSFFYRTQFIVLSILFPGLVRTFLLKRKIEILKVSHFDSSLPHPGRSFYDSPLKKRIKSLLGLA